MGHGRIVRFIVGSWQLDDDAFFMNSPHYINVEMALNCAGLYSPNPSKSLPLKSKATEKALKRGLRKATDKCEVGVFFIQKVERKVKYSTMWCD